MLLPDGLATPERLKSDPSTDSFQVSMVAAMGENNERLTAAASEASEHITVPWERLDLKSKPGGVLSECWG